MGEIVDLLSSRKSFDQVLAYAKDVYRIQAMSLSEKIPFARGSGEKSRREYFQIAVHVSTHHDTFWYKESLKPSLARGVQDISHQKFIRMGKNPRLEVREAYEISFKDVDGKEMMFWYEIKGDGTKQEKSYILK